MRLRDSETLGKKIGQLKSVVCYRLERVVCFRQFNRQYYRIFRLQVKICAQLRDSEPRNMCGFRRDRCSNGLVYALG